MLSLAVQERNPMALILSPGKAGSFNTQNIILSFVAVQCRERLQKEVYNISGAAWGGFELCSKHVGILLQFLFPATQMHQNVSKTILYVLSFQFVFFMRITDAFIELLSFWPHHWF